MEDQSASKESPALGDFPFNTFDKMRYADTARPGHVNNAAFSNFIETGRVEFLYDPQNRSKAEHASFAIASLNVTSLAEVNWSGRIDVGTGVARVSTVP